MIISILAVLGACGVLFAQQCAKNPPEEARYEVQVRNEAGELLNIYLTEKWERHGDAVVLDSYYAWRDNQWKYYEDRPLKILPKWGKVTIINRRPK